MVRYTRIALRAIHLLILLLPTVRDARISLRTIYLHRVRISWSLVIRLSLLASEAAIAAAVARSWVLGRRPPLPVIMLCRGSCVEEGEMGVTCDTTGDFEGSGK